MRPVGGNDRGAADDLGDQAADDSSADSNPQALSLWDPSATCRGCGVAAGAPPKVATGKHCRKPDPKPAVLVLVDWPDRASPTCQACRSWLRRLARAR